jgi:sigma-B regulation protein RsbU (phosphoserine phosphatase)
MKNMNLKRITEFVHAVEKGDLSLLPETSGGELGELEQAINRLVSELRTVREGGAEQEMLKRDMKISSAIQLSLLPSSLPEVPGFDLAAFYQPAQEIGGDYYDLIEIDDDHLGIVVADVSGKSVSGAMFMSITRNTIRAQSMLTLSPREVLERTQSMLLPSMAPGFFVSIFYAVLDKKEGRLSCANAGHPPLLWYRSGEKDCKWVGSHGVALGVLRNNESKIGEEQIVLKPNDLVLFYTDGISETVDEKENYFGRDRLGDLAKKVGTPGASAFLAALRKKLADFQGAAKQQDDMTAVVLQRK